METYFLVGIIVDLIIAIIPAKIAEKKGKDFTKWYLYGVLLFFFAMIHAIVLPEETEDNKNNLESIMTVKKVQNNDVNKDMDEIRYVDVNCPVEVQGVEIKVKEKSNLTCCALDFFNLSNKNVAAVKFVLKCYDSFGKPVTDNNEIEALVQDQLAQPKKHFGMDKCISLPNHSNTRKVDVIVTSVLFQDGSIWEIKENKLQNFKLCKIVDKQERDNLKTVVGNDAVCYSKILGDTWLCACGKLNSNLQEKCQRCERNREFVLNNYNTKESINKEIELISKQKAIEKEREKIEAQKMQLQEEKIKKEHLKKGIVGAAMFVLFGIVLLIGNATQYTFSYKGYQLKKHGIEKKYLNSINGDGKSYLLSAVETGDVEIFKILINNGADVNIKDAKGKTPLHSVASKNNIEMAKFLLENKANANIQDKSGQTPLHYAVSNNNLEMTKLLLKNKVRVDIKDKSGKSPLHQAAFVKDIDMIKLLIEKKADVNSKDNDLNTPLHYIYNSSLGIEKLVELSNLLTKNGANINIKNKIGKTALDYRVEEYIQKAKEAAKGNKYDEAIKHLDDILKLDKNNEQAKKLKYEYSSGSRELVVKEDKRTEKKESKIISQKQAMDILRNSDIESDIEFLQITNKGTISIDGFVIQDKSVYGHQCYYVVGVGGNAILFLVDAETGVVYQSLGKQEDGRIILNAKS